MGETGVYGGELVKNMMGISIYIWNVATESKVADTEGSTATLVIQCGF